MRERFRRRGLDIFLGLVLLLGLASVGQLHYDDALVALEGQPYDTQAASVYGAAAARGQATVSLTVLRAGLPLNVEISLQRFRLSQLFDLKLPDLIVGLGFWLLAVTVYTAHRCHPVNRVFALICGLLAGSLWLSIESVFLEADWLSRVLRLSWILIASFDGAALIDLAVLSPAPLDERIQCWMPAIYLASGVVAAGYVLAELLWWGGFHTEWGLQLGSLGLRASMGIAGAGAVFMVVRLVWLLWRRRASRRQRSQLTLVLTGLALAFPWIMLNVLGTMFAGLQGDFWPRLDLRYLMLACLLACALTIVRYQTFRRRQPLLEGLLILLCSGLLASVSTWLVPFLTPEWSAGVGGTVFPTLFILALGSSLFWSTRQAWQGAFNHLLRWEQRSYAAVREVGQQVISQADLARLPVTIAKALADNLQLECAAVWLWSEPDGTFRLVGEAGRWPSAPLACIPGACTLARPLRIAGERLPANLLPLRDIRGLEAVVPLCVSGQPIGLLGIGRRCDEEIFDERDVEIMELIGQQAALFMFAALQVEQLRQAPHLVAESQERQQFKIAQELHDTTQQFLGRLPFDLERSRESVEANPVQAKAILAQSLSDVEGAARTLRQIRNKLAPVQLEHNLEQPLRALTEQVRRRHGLEIHLDIAPEVDAPPACRPGARHALFRVVQQALDNTITHAQAQHVSILLATAPGRVCFSVTDDGRGSSDAERAEAAARGRLGLKSMATRITSLGGEFTFQSAPGEGTRVNGWLPMTVGRN